MSGGEEAEQLVETRARRQRVKGAKQNVRSTKKSTKSREVASAREKNGESTEARKRTERTTGRKTTESVSNMKLSKIEIKCEFDEQTHHQLQTGTRARIPKRQKTQTEFDTKSITEDEAASKESPEHLVETGTRVRGREEANVSTESAAGDPNAVGTVAPGGERRTRVAQTAREDHALKNAGSEENRGYAGVAVDESLNNDKTSSTATFGDVSERTSDSRRSTTSDKPEGELSLPLTMSPERSLDSSGADFKAECAAEATKGDETRWRNERSRSSMPRSIDDAIILPVTCATHRAELVLNRLESGSRGACVRQPDGSWLTPNEFQLVSGRGNAKDWKRSIRHHGHSLKSLVEQGLLSLASPPLCICEHCDVQVRPVAVPVSCFMSVM